MPQASRPKARLLILKSILEQHTDENNRLTKRELMELMKKEGSPIQKAALRDSLEILEDLGYDLDCQLDQQGAKRYCLLSREFEPFEVNILIDAVQSSRFISVKQSKELIGKLKQLVSKHQAEKMNERIFVDGRIKARNEVLFYNINEILFALDHDQWIRFDYYQYDAQKQLKEKRAEGHIVFPYAVVWTDDSYYLVGVLSSMPADMLTHFRIDRIKSVNVIKSLTGLEEPLLNPGEEKEKYRQLVREKKAFSVDDYMKKIFKMFTGKPCRVELRFHESIRNSIIDRFGSDSPVRPDGEGYYKIHADILLSEGFYYWVLQFTDKIEVLKPGHVREKVKTMAESIARLYCP